VTQEVASSYWSSEGGGLPIFQDAGWGEPERRSIKQRQDSDQGGKITTLTLPLPQRTETLPKNANSLDECIRTALWSFSEFVV